ncbi:formate dehydrogenase accessory sulfurtransferase FdhD [Methanocorpusculum vombati]|uniref:Formate dehydrogenase accessory sulfurtransferase FdhD n=1 Tax=Methanocorpusculum vombati TaxID=3002864 RepID=A0ABT4IN10_9EURY|nr:formate dehydrogenase accessory sulfurtransferase FdhD [Methanocorpusculum vombati]MCZ9319756.1 formate dehydrogenase accessory sulfurtransferase FdhD [Methanocorpusculum sp.]MCZ0863141.1 formate dehydrogenase accessory sulfurtransferase FdhD [Methanocorpusculum vombati]MDE2519859.1 formate dehydrogenase accessory sulfurtransferase FdhD [Methanocorpusculum sp.]MDE2534053.1 formate dehydrogenase accessory sulfurtransferase FdhD [Methanocorpusculum sp.]MDE2546015.1 formate dehydrogenase acces
MNTFSNGLFNEQAFALTVNGRNLLSVLMLPDLPDEFARGYLATEAIIPADEIESIMIDGATIGVLTRNPFKVLLPKRAVISGCGGTASYLDPARLPVISGGITIPADTLATPFPENILAAGGFCAAAVLPDGTAFTACDLSQPVALDKACGLLLHAGHQPASAALVISGKPTGDTIRKTLNAGFSILAAYQPPTALAVELAKTGSLTLADIPHKKIHTGPERIR